MIMKKLMSRYWQDESGATAIEYGLIAALIGVGCVIGISAVGQANNNSWSNIADTTNDVFAAN